MIVENDLFKNERQVAHNIYDSLKDFIPVSFPHEGASVNGQFCHFVFHIDNSLKTNYFNAFIHKSRIIFKIDSFDKKSFPMIHNDFCKAFNINVDTVDKVANAYFAAATQLERAGLLELDSDFPNQFENKPSSYVDFNNSYNQEYIFNDYTIARLFFKSAYKKNSLYQRTVISRIFGKIHFYYDKDNQVKPVFDFNVYFDQQYQASFIIDIHEDKVYTTRILLAARRYEDLIATARPIYKEKLQEVMESQFMSRLIPVIKKRYGLAKSQIDLSDIEMRNRYFSLLMMETI